MTSRDTEQDYAQADAAAIEQALADLNKEDDAIAAAANLQALSIKCTECGKLMANEALAQFHAEKSGHTSFEESTEAIKPLTEEEKKEKLEELRQRLAAKRAQQSKEDSETAKANEQIRRKAGQEMGEAREELKRKEALREAEKRKQEARAEVEAKKRVKEQIEADKRERAERIAREKAMRDGGPAPEMARAAAAAAATTIASLPTAGQAAAASSTQARLRVRLPTGMWTGTLGADATLQSLEEQLRSDGQASGPLSFSMTFPRKTFTDSEKTLSLRSLGLVPSAALEAAPRK